MKEVVVKNFFDGYTSQQKMFIDGREVLYIRDLSDCPEDAIIGRDLIDAFDIIRIAKIFNGEEFEVQTQECDTEEEFNNY